MSRNTEKTDRRERPQEEGEEFIEKLVAVNRVAKVVKGGKRFSFAAILVIGDGKGRVGHGTGKAREVPEAIRKATEAARRNMIRVPMREGRTLHHDAKGHFGAGRVIIRSAPAGTGVIAGGAQRAVFEALGIQDVVAKATGTTNPHNLIKATFDALKNTESPRTVAARRGKRVSDLFGKVDAAAAEQAETAAE
jgi:small subunit ribosomal protein S5